MCFKFAYYFAVVCIEIEHFYLKAMQWAASEA